MCDIIEKLGISKGTWKIAKDKKGATQSLRTDDFNESNLMGDYRGCIIADFRGAHGYRKHAYKEVEANALLFLAAPEMFKSFIDRVCTDYQCVLSGDLDLLDIQEDINIIEKAAGMPWQEIRVLL